MPVCPVGVAGPAVDAQLEALAAGLASPRFASRDDVESVAALLRTRVGRGSLWQAGAQAQLLVSAGTVAIRLGAGREATDATDLGTDYTVIPGSVPGSRGPEGDHLEQGVLFDVDEEPATRGAITKWSPASRRRMVRTIAELDLSAWPQDEGVLAMVTLTLADYWQLVAPTGADFKRLVELLRRRWVRQVRTPWRGIWKLEFQRRGAPHLHALMRVPANVGRERFEDWLSRTWADICLDALGERDALAYIDLGEYDRHLAAGTGVDFSGVKFSDPRRTSIYFLKHSTKTKDSKEYQHTVPTIWRVEGAGPGRFWGVWGLSRAVAAVPLEWETMHTARRFLRHLARSQRAKITLDRLRAEHGAGTHDLRQALVAMKHERVRSLGTAGGWVLVNDGLAVALELARAVVLAGADPISLYSDRRRAQSAPQVAGHQLTDAAVGVGPGH